MECILLLFGTVKRKDYLARVIIFGIKPLYIAEQDDTTFFASEKKSILHIMQDKEVNPTSLQHYFTYQYGPEPETLTNDINKIEPGHYFIKEIGKEIEIHCYWKPYFNAVDTPKEQHIQAIRDVLYDSVKVHMRSDVPVGAFLSGGIDSSIIASIAKRNKSKSLNILCWF